MAVIDSDRILARFKEIIKEYGQIKATEYDNLDIPDKPARTTIVRHLGARTFDDATWIILNKDKELIIENVRLAKQAQKFRDSNRIERKAFREWARIENAVTEYNKELIGLLKQYNFKNFTRKHPDYTENEESNFNKAVGIIQLSDLHFNERVELSFNRFDFKIASARLKYFIKQAKKYFSVMNVRNIVVIMTADLMNSDRLLDQLLNEATNRSKATFLSVDILKQVLLDLNRDFNVKVAGVIGNESRVHEQTGLTDIVATDSYDWTIYHFLRYLFNGSDIVFDNMNDPLEGIIKIAGQNVLFLHGNNSVSHSHIEKSITQLIGRKKLEGIEVDYVIIGHQHSARIGDNYSRSSSLVGANDYSSRELNLASRASQNIYIFYENGNRDGIKIDLQNYDENDYYNIDENLAEYNVKSANKCKKHTKIMEIVI